MKMCKFEYVGGGICACVNDACENTLKSTEPERCIANCTGPPTHRDKTKSFDCSHRGEALRTIDCKGCRGNTRIKVFECTIHTECTLAKQVGVAVCKTCEDYKTEDNHEQ